MVFRIRITHILLAALVLVGITSCGDDDELVLSNVPVLEFNSLNPSSIQEFDGPITFTVKYEDGDGDLGENSPNVKNLFLKDNRNGIVYEYRLQQLAPNDASIPIRGTFDVILANTAITDGSNEQSATFDIYVVDRSGNASNTITSTPLTVFK